LHSDSKEGQPDIAIWLAFLIFLEILGLPSCNLIDSDYITGVVETRNQTQGDEMSQYEAVKMVAEIIRDATRIDRYLRVANDGHYYTSPDKTFLTNDGPETPPYVVIPFGGTDASDDEYEESARMLLSELDMLVD
jgi:hypothetical protein